MSREERVKILLLGPSKVGKSCIADVLSGTRDTPTTEYKETRPLRIFECILDGLNLSGGRRVGRGTRAAVELWDCSGSTRFQGCWSAMKNKADGVIFVFNPEIAGQERELEFYHKSFAAEMHPDRFIAFAHHSTAPDRAIGANATPKLTGALSSVKSIETSLDFQSDDFKGAFERLVERILMSRREAEENATMKNDVMAGAIAIGQSH
jgi:Rab family protein